MNRVATSALIALTTMTLLAGPTIASEEDVLHSSNIRSLAREKASGWLHRGTFQGDLAFPSYAGVSGGFEVFELGGSRAIERLGRFPCPGNNEGSIASWRHFVFQAIESPDSANGRLGQMQSPGSKVCGPNVGGIRVVDVSDPDQPFMAGFITLPCGSHSFTLRPTGSNLVIYNSNSCSLTGEESGSTGQGGLSNAPGTIEVIDFDPVHPSKSVIHGKPTLVGMEGGCHDITIWKPRKIGVCTGTGQWALIDVSNTYNPSVLHVERNFNSGAGSAQFTWDGNYVLMNIIPLRSFVNGESCFQTHELYGGMIIYNVEDTENPLEVGRIHMQHQPPMWEVGEADYKCHASNFTVVPMNDPSRYVAVTTWGEAGLSVFDFTDPTSPREIGYWQPQWANISWWGAWYNGRIYISENDVGEDNDATWYADAQLHPEDLPAYARVLEMTGLGTRQTRSFKDGLVTQFQDPANLGR